MVISSTTQKRATAKTFTINRATLTSPSLLERYCRGLDGRPRSWMGWEKDVPPGEKLVARFRPFLEALVVSDLSPKTIQRHVDNLWLLGGDIIRDLTENPSLRNRKSRCNAHSTPLAGSFTASSANFRAENLKITYRFRDEVQFATGQ